MLDTTHLKAKLKLSEQLNKKYPDIKTRTDRWGHIYYISKDIIPNCNQVEIKYSCGCCDDAVVLAMPYIKDEELKVNIYGATTEIYIGNRNTWRNGDIPIPHWQRQFYEAGYDNTIIETVANYFDRRRPEE